MTPYHKHQWQRLYLRDYATTGARVDAAQAIYRLRPSDHTLNALRALQAQHLASAATVLAAAADR